MNNKKEKKIQFFKILFFVTIYSTGQKHGVGKKKKCITFFK